MSLLTRFVLIYCLSLRKSIVNGLSLKNIVSFFWARFVKLYTKQNTDQNLCFQLRFHEGEIKGDEIPSNIHHFTLAVYIVLFRYEFFLCERREKEDLTTKAVRSESLQSIQRTVGKINCGLFCRDLGANLTLTKDITTMYGLE